MTARPHVDNAPGITWRLLKYGWECRWRARTDLVKKGFAPKIVKLWSGTTKNPTPTEQHVAWIVEQANKLQGEMLTFGRGGLPKVAGVYDYTVKTLIECYQSDKDSPYHKKRYATRNHYDTLCRRLEADCGSMKVADLDARTMLRLHEGWAVDGKVAMGHAVIGMLRTLATFGKTLLKCTACKELKSTLHDMRFEMPKKRKTWITWDQSVAVRKKAHELGYHSIALAQAFQWDIMLRQKDVIGEWVPMSEPGLSTVHAHNDKWLRGITGQEIDKNLILRHVTSKKGKDVEFDLTLAPSVMEEIRFLAGLTADATVIRDHFPGDGPLVICETTGVPWTDFNFRRKWREIATAAGVPENVYNMDSRAGAITEATDAGAPLEHVRQAATHSDMSTTAGYSRGTANKMAEVARARIESRNKTGTK